MANSQILGIVAPIPQGDWSNETQYNQLNIVRAGKAAYMAVVANKGIEPGVTTNWSLYWKKLTQDGRSLSSIAVNGSPTQNDGYTVTTLLVTYDDNTSETVQVRAKNGTNIDSVTQSSVRIEGGYTITTLSIALDNGQTKTVEVKAKNGEAGGTSIYVGNTLEQRVDFDTDPQTQLDNKSKVSVNGTFAASVNYKKAVTATATLAVSGWSGTANNWVQTITVQGVTADSTQYIDIPADSTTDNQTAFAEALLRDGGQSANQITLKSVADEAPSSNINIRITIAGGIV